MSSKVCKKCGQEKSLSGFYRNKECSLGYENICKKCRNKHTVENRDKEKHNSNQRDYVKRNKERILEVESARYHSNPERVKDVFYRRRYGISLEEAYQMYAEQGGYCAICASTISLEVGAPNSAHLDHCHSSSVVRGLLCSNCNTGLGLFKDNPNLLLKAAEYLTKNE